MRYTHDVDYVDREGNVFPAHVCGYNERGNFGKPGTPRQPEVISVDEIEPDGVMSLYQQVEVEGCSHPSVDKGEGQDRHQLVEMLPNGNKRVRHQIRKKVKIQDVKTYSVTQGRSGDPTFRVPVFDLLILMGDDYYAEDGEKWVLLQNITVAEALQVGGIAGIKKSHWRPIKKAKK